MRIAACLVLLLAVVGAGTNARDQELASEDPFVGLDGVSVYVEEPDSAFVTRGITADVIRTPIALMLRQNGIPILDEGDPGSASGNPVLWVAVEGVLDEAMQQYAYQIQMELTQTVQLERDPGITLPGATTWRAGGIALSGPQWRESLLNDLDYYAGLFVDEYLAAREGE